MTRYPKSGKTRKWTLLELKAIPSDWRGDTLQDGGGLSGEVRVATDSSVSVRFKYAYKSMGKVRWFQCGTWPMIGLEEIRGNRDRARESLRVGKDPTTQKQAEKIQNQAELNATIEADETRKKAELKFEDMFRQWLEFGVARADGNAELRRSFGRDVLPVIGNEHVGDVTEASIIALLRLIGLEGGLGRSAVVRYRDIRQLFRWAESRQPWRRLLVNGNPAANISLSLFVPKDYDDAEARARTLSEMEVRMLADRLQTSREAYALAPNKYRVPRPLKDESELALWIAFSTMCRIGEILQATWSEVNLEKREWLIPKTRTKSRVELLVFLSDFAVAKFAALHALTGATPWCFPNSSATDHVSPKSVTKQVGDRQIAVSGRTKQYSRRSHSNSLVLGTSGHEKWTPHDLRRTGSTMMQALGIDNETRERCLNHSLGTRVRKAYARYQFADEKRIAWQRLGEAIASLIRPIDRVESARLGCAVEEERCSAVPAVLAGDAEQALPRTSS